MVVFAAHDARRAFLRNRSLSFGRKTCIQRPRYAEVRQAATSSKQSATGNNIILDGSLAKHCGRGVTEAGTEGG